MNTQTNTLKRNDINLLTALVLGVILAQPAQALTLPVSDDAFINQSLPNENNGIKKNLTISNTVQTREAYARFNLSALPKDAEINLAMLRIWVDKAEMPGNFTVHEVTGAWDEQSLTAANVPVTNAAFATVPISQTLKNNYLLADITQLVKDWQNGSPNNGIALRPDASSQFNMIIDSKENERTSHPMEIEVAFEGPPGPKGDKGDSGVQGEKGETGPTGPQGLPGSVGLQGPVGPAGLQGSKGNNGNNGLNGVSGYEIVAKNIVTGVSPFSVQTFKIDCPAGKVALSASINILINNSVAGEDVNQHPTTSPSSSSWSFDIQNRDLFNKTFQTTVTCINAS